MKSKKIYIFLKSDDDTCIEKFLVKYDSRVINNMINSYSVELGAHLFKRRFFGNISSYENGRIIYKERNIIKRETKKSTASIYTYDCTIIEDECKFIKVLLNSFTTFSDKTLNIECILLNFSKIYDMLNDNMLDENIVNFLKRLFSHFKIVSQEPILCNEPLLYGKYKIEEIARKNSYIFKYFKNIQTR